MKTQVMTFKINKPYEHWEKNFDNHKEDILESGHMLETTEQSIYLG
tara:strand:+ start:429 stop:566 length:138 start_codon:yes stop_codon:yes gene_type:complete